MSHPNPYLFQINRMVLQALSRMDISASARSYPLQDVMDIKDVFFMYGRVVLYCCLYEHDLLYIIFIQSFIIVNFNVSSIKLMRMLNFLDTFSMGVTFGIRACRFRSCHGSLSYN
jgi:hypothetical protein